MRAFQWILGVLIGIQLVVVLAITSVQAVVYNDRHFINEYAKYNVYETVGITSEDLMYVTDEMMDYLVAERDSLDNINVAINGVEREFFNDREKAHMVDVRDLFLIALKVRRWAVIGIFVMAAAAILIKKGGAEILAKAIQYFIAAFAAAIGVLAALISIDFTKAFTIFHHIFFNNDLWILDARTDLLINIVPEGFFIDTGIWIGIVFGGMCAVVFAAMAVVRFIYNKRRA